MVPTVCFARKRERGLRDRGGTVVPQPESANATTIEPVMNLMEPLLTSNKVCTRPRTRCVNTLSHMPVGLETQMPAVAELIRQVCPAGQLIPAMAQFTGVQYPLLNVVVRPMPSW